MSLTQENEQLKDQLHTALQDVQQKEEDATGLRECLQMVREELEYFLGQGAMEGVPPMNYNDVIHTVVRKAINGELAANMRSI